MVILTITKPWLSSPEPSHGYPHPIQAMVRHADLLWSWIQMWNNTQQMLTKKTEQNTGYMMQLKYDLKQVLTSNAWQPVILTCMIMHADLIWSWIPDVIELSLETNAYKQCSTSSHPNVPTKACWPDLRCNWNIPWNKCKQTMQNSQSSYRPY